MAVKILRFQLDDANPGDAEVARILGELSPSTAKNYLTAAVLYYSRSPLLPLNDSVQKILSKICGMDGMLQSLIGSVDALHVEGVALSQTIGQSPASCNEDCGQKGDCELDAATTLRLRNLLDSAEI